MKLIFSDAALHFPAIGGGHGICDVRVYVSADGLEGVVLVIEDDRNADQTSITNRATDIAQRVSLEIQDVIKPNAVVRWVEIYANVVHPEPDVRLDGVHAWVRGRELASCLAFAGRGVDRETHSGFAGRG